MKNTKIMAVLVVLLAAALFVGAASAADVTKPVTLTATAGDNTLYLGGATNDGKFTPGYLMNYTQDKNPVTLVSKTFKTADGSATLSTDANGVLKLATDQKLGTYTMTEVVDIVSGKKYYLNISTTTPSVGAPTANYATVNVPVNGNGIQINATKAETFKLTMSTNKYYVLTSSNIAGDYNTTIDGTDTTVAKIEATAGKTNNYTITTLNDVDLKGLNATTFTAANKTTDYSFGLRLNTSGELPTAAETVFNSQTGIVIKLDASSAAEGDPIYSLPTGVQTDLPVGTYVTDAGQTIATVASNGIITFASGLNFNTGVTTSSSYTSKQTAVLKFTVAAAPAEIVTLTITTNPASNGATYTYFPGTTLSVLYDAAMAPASINQNFWLVSTDGTIFAGTPKQLPVGQLTTADIGTYVYSATTPTAGTAAPATAMRVTVANVPGTGGSGPTATAYSPIAAGADAFVYEHIQIIGSSSSKLTKYSDGSNPAAVNQISGTAGQFYLTEEVVGGQYGKYFYGGVPTDDNNAQFIYIWYPELTMQAELTQANNGVAGDSIDGKTVNKDTKVTFLINAPKVGPAFVARGNPAIAKIVFTTPVSGKTTAYGTADFAAVTLDAAQTFANKVGIVAGDDAAAGTYTAQTEYTFPKAFSDYAKKSNTISFTLQSSTLTITAAKDSVVRSNPFTVTISGKAQTVYAIYLENAISTDKNPTLQSSQNGFQSEFKIDSTNANAPVAVIGGAFFKTDASGKRTIQYNTAADTEDKTYTIKVNGLATPYTAGMTTAALDTADYDKVKVKIEKGAVTIAASGDGSYYIGDEIKLTGTNTDSSNIFLFLTGQNLLENGIVLKNLPNKVAAHLAANPVAVKTDNTWEYKWDTSQIALDTGAYTIYATSRLTNGKASDKIETTSKYGEQDGNKYYAVKLSDSEYATVSVNLKQPFLSAVPSGTVIAQGDKLYVRGTAEGKPNNLKLYIFGPNFFEDFSITVEDDGTYEKKIDISSSMSSNQYFVVVQHPMYNGVFDADLIKEQNGNYQYFKILNSTTGGSQQGSFVVWGANKLQGSQAADALTKMIDDANIDDIYTKLTFTVAAPWIRISNPGDQAAGSKFTITGTTNLAVDDQILVEVMSSSFTAVDKTSTSTTSGVSQTTKVVKGETDNTWSVDVDTTNWKLDEYTIKVNGIEVDVTTTTNFNLVEKVATPTPTATGATPTATATATATATETPKTPGFGAFIALAGLGAVALLVLRRN